MGCMTPTGWQPYRRAEDDELVGYLSTDERGTTPLTLFGYPLSDPVDEAAAVEVLQGRGRSALGEPWWLQEEDGSGFRVQILAAYPDEVRVARADYGFVSHDSERRSLPVPTGDRLRPFRGD
jgi:hypothetical protein